MSNPAQDRFVKCACPRCEQHIEYPAIMAHELATCPSCQWPLTFYIRAELRSKKWVETAVQAPCPSIRRCRFLSEDRNAARGVSIVEGGLFGGGVILGAKVIVHPFFLGFKRAVLLIGADAAIRRRRGILVHS
jgi:hypothetical protein